MTMTEQQVPTPPDYYEGLQNALSLDDIDFELMYADTNLYVLLASMRRVVYELSHDYLTGMQTKDTYLKKGIHRIARLGERTIEAGGYGLALFFIDLDGFKVINDAHGHEAGDHVLSVIAARIQKTIRPKDALVSSESFRMGGDEFLVVTPLVPRENHQEAEVKTISQISEIIGRRIIDAVNEPIAMNDKDITVGASIGFVSIGAEVIASLQQGNQATLEELVHQADSFMYQAKKSANNIVSGA